MKTLSQILKDPRLFASVVIGLPLRSYQFAPVARVMASCIAQAGYEFLWVFPRQSGKDEAVAQMEVMLMNLYQLEESNIIHCYPGELQIQIGVDRLENRLDNLLNQAQWKVAAKPARRILGRCSVTFLSGHPMAKSEGQTAHPLVIINECQDHDELIVQRRFTPFAAANNATILYVGTVRTEEDLLWKTYNRLRSYERKDRHKRVYMVTPEQVIAENEAYGEFLRKQIEQHGRQHPVIKTEYFNEPVAGKALLFPRRRQLLLKGEHKREDAPDSNKIYVGLVDVGGIDESATGEFGELENPERDYTCGTVVEIFRGGEGKPPVYKVRDVIVEQGVKHFAGDYPLIDRLEKYLKYWQVKAVVCDGTGVGAGMADALTRRMNCEVNAFAFHKNHNKSRLGNEFLSLVENGRVKYFAEDGEGSDGWWFFKQVEMCGYELRPGASLDTGLKWGVSDRAKALCQGQNELVHDDRLLSLALICEVERQYQAGGFTVSTGESAVIPRELEEGGWV